jgi:DNA transposition AAA+ family ATPase
MSDLAPQAIVEVVASLADTKARVSALERIISNGFISTHVTETGINWIDERRFLKQCGRLVGPRESGKSRLCEEYENRDFERVIRLKAPTNCSSKRLHRLILKAMNHAAKVRRRDDPRPTVVESVTPLGVEVILVDNAHNLDLEALSDLKDLYDETGVTIIFSGTSDLDVLLENADLLGSFPYHYPLAPLLEADFKKVLDTIEEIALNLPCPSLLSEGEKFEILTRCTGSLIGRLMKLLPTAILYSVQKVSEQEKPTEGEAECMPVYKLDNISLEALKKLEPGFGVKVPSRKANSQ